MKPSTASIVLALAACSQNPSTSDVDATAATQLASSDGDSTATEAGSGSSATDTTIATSTSAVTTSDTSSDASTSTQSDASGSSDSSGGAPVVKFVGNITTSGMVREDFVDYWNQITPENEGKWGSVEAEQDVMNWGPLDAVYDYAMDQGIPFKQHTLVWGSQQPGWIAGLPADQQAEEVEEWIAAFCERYPETAIIDVVNEPPPHTTPPYAEAIGGAGATGYDWIVWSFATTRQYCPDAILVLNDYNVLRWNTDSFVSIVNAIQDSGYVDALGAQAHGLETIEYDELEANLATVLATGLPLYISEYDINIADDDAQRDVMAEQFALFWETEQIAGITLWGYIHGSTWQPDTGLIRDGEHRPAMTWLLEYLQGR